MDHDRKVQEVFSVKVVSISPILIVPSNSRKLEMV